MPADVDASVDESLEVVPSVVHALESVAVDVSSVGCVDCVVCSDEVSDAVAGSSPEIARPSHDAANTATALPATRPRSLRIRLLRAAARSWAAGDGWRRGGRGGGSEGGVLLMPILSARFMSPA